MHIYKHIVDLSFSRVRGVRPSLTLKAAVVNAYDNQNDALSDVSDAFLWHVSLC
jgi:hypothetical protein